MTSLRVGRFTAGTMTCTRTPLNSPLPAERLANLNAAVRTIRQTEASQGAHVLIGAQSPRQNSFNISLPVWLFRILDPS